VFALPLSRLLVIRDRFHKFVNEKEKLAADISGAMMSERGSNGSNRVGKNDSEAGPSGTKKDGAL
jgi:hypothetical protein